MKNSYGIISKIVGFLTGSLFNIAVTAILIVLVVSYAQKSYVAGRSFADGEAMTKDPKPVTITVPEEADALEIAGILEENGLTSNKYYFWLQARVNGSYKYFRSGEFELNTAMKAQEIMEILQSLPPEDESEYIKITIPEGFNIKQIAERLEDRELFSAEEFLEACESRDYNYGFLEPVKDRENYLEGYLFPDTYFLSNEPTPDELIRKMLDRFDDVFDIGMINAAEEAGLSVDDAVKLASMIEREIRRDDEREKASAVMHNRLNTGMPMQIDATVMYVLNKGRDRLTEDDLKVDSPYNTYLYPGLPFGPISNPGLPSLMAAVNPAKANYLYYVLINEETGEHFYTSSYDEFLREKAKAAAARE